MIQRIFAAVLLAVSLVATTPARADGEVAWTVHCGFSHFGADDPIVHPNMAGMSHMHAFFGNNSTNAASTTASLLASGSSCERGFDTSDHSAYWVPALYRKTATGTELVAGSSTAQRMTVYYRRAGGSSGPQVRPFPQGFRMIAGDAGATQPQSQTITYWRCYATGGGSHTDSASATPTCSGTQYLFARVVFPNCWDGKNLDSADHKSHVAYPSSSGVCPATHPVALPSVKMEVSYKQANGAGSQYQLASGGQYSMHADFFAAWDDQVQSALVNSCLNAGKDCTDITRADVNLASATAITSPGPGAVLGAQSPPSATPKPATSPSLPDTGALPAAAVGVAIMAIGYYLFRRHRHALRQALIRLK